MTIEIIIGVVSTVVTVLALFFDVPQKIHISKKKFIFLSVLISFVICLIVSLLDCSGENTNLIKNNDREQSNFYVEDSSVSSAETAQTSNDSKFYVEDSSVSSAETTQTSNDSTLIEKDGSSSIGIVFNGFEEAQHNNDELYIDSIINSLYNVDSIICSSVSLPTIKNIKYTGDISIDGQYNDHPFIPQFSGIHRFEFSNVPNGTDFRLRVLNSGLEQLSSGYDLDNGDGLTVSLIAGETYYARVEYYNNTGSYTLNIGQKKEIIDVTGYTDFSDTIQYTDQENDYLFKANLDGVYRFEFSNVPNGTDFRLRIYNSGWEQLQSAYDLDNNDGITISLTAGEVYYIRVEQYNNIGAYTLNIGLKKAIVDITDYTQVSDTIQYTDQENDYLFKANLDGVYRFEFSNVPNGTDFRLRIYNSGWEQLQSAYDLDNNDGITISLTAGEVYYIRVEQYNNIGSYTLNVGKKKVITDITSYKIISDSIQYTNQENDYMFRAYLDGTYKFVLSNVSNGTDLQLIIYNSGWERLQSSYHLNNDDELTVSVTNGELYYIRVIQCCKSGDYTLLVEELQ